MRARMPLLAAHDRSEGVVRVRTERTIGYGFMDRSMPKTLQRLCGRLAPSDEEEAEQKEEEKKDAEEEDQEDAEEGEESGRRLVMM